jgi:DnaJ-like protein
MSLEKFIEDQITRAMEKGEFDDLPGKGKPLDLDWYFACPEDQRLSYSILRNAKVIPEEAQLLGEIERLKQKLDSCSDESERDQIKKKLRDKTLSFNVLMERGRRSK